MSKTSWDKLTPEDQAIFKQAAKDSRRQQREQWTAKVKESAHKVRPPASRSRRLDKQPFIDAMGPVYEKYAATPEMKKLVEDIQATE